MKEIQTFTKLHLKSCFKKRLGYSFSVLNFGSCPVNYLSWEENKCYYKLSKCTKWHLFHSKWSKLSFWVKIVVICQLLSLYQQLFSSHQSLVKWDNSRNSTQKMRTYIDWKWTWPLAKWYFWQTSLFLWPSLTRKKWKKMEKLKLEVGLS